MVKIPILIEHFIEHKEKDQSLSLWQFLDMHYAQGDLKDADYDQDMKLPFKSHDGCLNSSTVIFVNANFETLEAKSLTSLANTYSVYNEPLLPSAYLSFIWQPPKVC
ncbi:hypothetical protein [Aurantibacillus circumpalustris]|uniref:hypothetical protein n=1 Tax=Aurantibacillus circumpalustris TaxID=3036359 RepID=UPI00295AACA6|nr:hypothetical protein [Aurantibacillus circumpalustris]